MIYVRILEAKIYGFGKWVDYTLKFPSGSPVCVFGENESGKSTLQRFILFILFGLPPKQRMFYRPKTSSKMGGRLLLSHPKTGNIIIERLDNTRNGAAVCYTEDGLEHDENWLSEQLNGLTQNTYKSIYSFDANDLSDIQNMKQEDVGDILLGIGLTGSTRIHTLEKQLDAKIGELFKPHGTKPMINEQISKLNQLTMSAEEYKKEENTYHEKVNNLQQLEKEKVQLQTKLQIKKQQANKLEKQMQALPYAHEYKKYINELKLLPTDRSFPQDGMERLKDLKANELPLISELSILKTDEDKYLTEKSQLEGELKQAPSINEFKKVLDLKSVYFNNQQTLKKLTKTMNSLDLEITNALNELNIGIQLDDLHTIELPFHTEKTWNELKNTASQLKLEKEQLAEEIQIASSKQSYLQKELVAAQEKQLTKTERQNIETKIEAFNENELFHKFNQDAKKSQKDWEKNKSRMKKGHQSVLGGGMILAISLLILYFITNVNLFINSAIISFVVGIIFWGWGYLSIKNLEKLKPTSTYDIQTSSYTEDEQEKAKRLLAQDDEWKRDEKAIRDQLRNYDIQSIQYDEKMKAWHYRNDRLQEQIKEQDDLHPYLSKVEINFWSDLYHRLKNLIRLRQQKQELESEFKTLNQKQLTNKNEINTLILEETTQNSTQTVEQQFAVIEQWHLSIDRKKTRVVQLNELICENKNRQHQLLQDQETYRQEKKSLYNVAGVSDEESYYKKAANIQKGQQLETSIDKIREQFSTIFTKDEWANLINDIPNQSELEFEIKDIKTSLKHTEEQLDKVRQKIADIHAELTKIEKSETYSELMYRIDVEKGSLSDIAKQWAVHKTAKEVLTKTKWRYRDKYLYQVIDLTTVYFKELTNNQYTQIYTPEKNKPFLVEARDTLRYTVDELSQGTINQLYVSLRLAISETMNRQHQFPFIIDDAFVHFDGVRMKRIMEILQRQSKQQQFIIFTCKEEVVRNFRNANIIDLNKNVSHV